MKKWLIIFLLIPSICFAQDSWLGGRGISDIDIIQFDGMSAPATSNLGDARIYFDITAGTLKCSEDGGAYTDCVNSGSSSEITIQEGDVTLDTDIGTIDFDSSHFQVSEGPENEANIAFNTDGVKPLHIDDDANSPTAGDFVIIETGAASFDYLTPNAGTDITADLEEEVSEGSLADDTIVEADLKAVDSPSDEECLTYEATGGDFEWQSCGSGGITAVGSMTSGDAFADSTADDDWLGLGASAGRIEFDDQTTDEVNVLDAYVGIGTSTPTFLLDLKTAETVATDHPVQRWILTDDADNPAYVERYIQLSETGFSAKTTVTDRFISNRPVGSGDLWKVLLTEVDGQNDSHGGFAIYREDGVGGTQTSLMKLSMGGSFSLGQAVNVVTDSDEAYIKNQNSNGRIMYWGLNGTNSANIGGLFVQGGTIDTSTQIFGVSANNYGMFYTGGQGFGVEDTTPDALLEVSASAGADDLIMLSADDSGDGDLFIVLNNGDVGISHTTPTALLDIGGGTTTYIDGTNDIVVTDDVEINGDLYVDGGIFGTGGTQGVTDSSSYWLCTASDCSTSCQVTITDGLITSCT